MISSIEYAKLALGLFSIVNPIGTVPVFTSLTARQSPTERLRTARSASIATGAVLFATLIAGEALLSFFGISLPSFRVGGGIIILLMAIAMVQAKVSPTKQTEEEAQDALAKHDVAVVPLGIPLLAGPGAISTIIVYAHMRGGIAHYAILSAIITFVAILVWLCLRAAPFITKVCGKTGINVATRIMGLMMAALGVEFIVNGLKDLFHLAA